MVQDTGQVSPPAARLPLRSRRRGGGVGFLGLFLFGPDFGKFGIEAPKRVDRTRPRQTC